MSAIAILKLERSGFTASQVEALAEYLDGQAASKADLDKATGELKADIAHIATELKTEVGRLEGKIETGLAAQKAEILKWMFGALLGQTAIVAALVKLL